MRKAPFYRYFLGFRPSPPLRNLLATVAEEAGQQPQPETLHLTACVVAECRERDAFLCRRVAIALVDQALSSFVIFFGRVRGGPNGALVRTVGKQGGIQDFYRTLLDLLAPRGIAPLHRKSGLRPHVTLGYAPCQFDPFEIALEWSPDELLLIESEVGNGTHRVVGRWPLLPPPQGSLCFAAPFGLGSSAVDGEIDCPIADFG